MNEDEIMGVARRLLAHAQNGTTDQGELPWRIDLSVYSDPEVFGEEKEVLFRRGPLIVAMSADLPEPGSYFAIDDHDVPMLLTRDEKGQLHAFLNACAHRGAPVAQGCGAAKRLTCPFHAWSYRMDGRLASIAHEKSFGSVPHAKLGLTPLPCAERHGLIWVRPTPGEPIDPDALLSGLGPQLGGWQLERAEFVNSKLVPAEANWKLAMDTFAEGYHFGSLHSKTVGPSSITNLMTYDRYGRNHRLGFPARSIPALAKKAETDWNAFAYFSFIHFLFPNINLFVSPEWVYLFRLYPGDRVDRHHTRFGVYAREPLAGEKEREQAQQLFEFILYTFEKEDYWVSARIQRAIGAEGRRHSVFGRNEPTLADMHRSYREALGRDAAEVLTPLREEG